MKRVCLILFFPLLFSFPANAQNIAINTTGAAADASAILDLNSGNNGTRGFLPEQVALTATNVAAPVTSPETGLLVYNTSTAGTTPNNVVPGYYYWSGTLWLPIANDSKSSIKLPYVDVSAAFTFNYYTGAYTPGSGYNYPLMTSPITTLNSITTISYWGTFNNSLCTVSSNGEFSRAYGWINSGTTGTVTVYAYVYTLTNNSTAALSGTQIGSATVTISTASRNYSFELIPTSAPFTLTKGQMLMLWYYPSVNMTNMRANGTVEFTQNPQ